MTKDKSFQPELTPELLNSKPPSEPAALPKEDLTKEEHIDRHKYLHNALDELVADWIGKTGKFPSKNSIRELINWSHQQTLNPDTEGVSIYERVEKVKETIRLATMGK